MTPHPSNTCYDKYLDCADMCNTSLADSCKKSCGGCDGNLSAQGRGQIEKKIMGENSHRGGGV